MMLYASSQLSHNIWFITLHDVMHSMTILPMQMHGWNNANKLINANELIINVINSRAFIAKHFLLMLIKYKIAT